MNKPKSKRLDIVRKLAEQSEENAAQKLRQQRQKIDQEEHQLQSLKTYYMDYLERIDSQTQVTANDVITYREFSTRLSQAVKQQELKITNFQSQLELANKEWLILREKRKAIDDLIKKSYLDEQNRLSRREQKLLDELSVTSIRQKDETGNGRFQ